MTLPSRTLASPEALVPSVQRRPTLGSSGSCPAPPAHPHHGTAPDAGNPADDERIRALERELDQLRTAMASRATIEQAKGILMLLAGCGEQVAFQLLAHISSTTHRKVRDIAVAITESACGHATLPADIQEQLRDVCPPSHRAH